MDLKLTKIMAALSENNITKENATQLLVSLIENSTNTEIRKKSIHYLKKININQDFLFQFLENLLVTDTNNQIRVLAAQTIRERFLDRALKPMKWAICYERDYDCLMEIIETLLSINTAEAKEIIWQKIQQKRERMYIDNRQNYLNKQFRKSTEWIVKEKNILIDVLGEILVNYLTIQRLIEKFYTVFFEWEKGVIQKLDLSEIGWNVNVWKQKYAERISTLSEISEIQRLTHLKRLDLSKNRLSSIKKLTNLRKITHLWLSNNKLKDLKNIEYLKMFPNLQFLDIAGNRIADNIQQNDMKGIYLVKHHGFGKKLNQFNILYELYS